MLVARRMRSGVHTLRPDDPIAKAAELFANLDIRHAPVVTAPEGVLVGMISGRDLGGAGGEAWHQAVGLQPAGAPRSALRVGDLMTTALVTVTPDTTIEKAALLLVGSRIGALPVVDDDGVLVGILTKTDLIEVFIEVMGIGVPSTRIELGAAEGAEVLGQVVELIQRAGGNVLSVVSVRDSVGADDPGSADGAQPAGRIIHVRIEDAELEPILSALESAGIEVLSVDEHEPG